MAGLPLLFDSTIPTVCTSPVTNQLIVTNPVATLAFIVEPTTVAYPETLASQMRVVVRLLQYAAFVVVYPAGVAATSGAAYISNPAFV